METNTILIISLAAVAGIAAALAVLYHRKWKDAERDIWDLLQEIEDLKSKHE